jgi:predicted nucleic acid-binding protein
VLAVAVVNEVRYLLGEGLGQRATARTTGVSRGTVAAIAHDRWAPVRGDRAGQGIAPPVSAEVIAAARRAAARRGPEPLRELFAQGAPALDLRPHDRHGYFEVRKKLRAEGELPPGDDLAEPDTAV